MRLFFLATGLAAALGLWDVNLRLETHRGRIREAVAAQEALELESELARLRAERQRVASDPELWKHIESLGFRRELGPSRQLARELKEGRPGGVQARRDTTPVSRW